MCLLPLQTPPPPLILDSNNVYFNSRDINGYFENGTNDAPTCNNTGWGEGEG